MAVELCDVQRFSQRWFNPENRRDRTNKLTICVWQRRGLRRNRLKSSLHAGIRPPWLAERAVKCQGGFLAGHLRSLEAIPKPVDCGIRAG